MGKLLTCTYSLLHTSSHAHCKVRGPTQIHRTFTHLDSYSNTPETQTLEVTCAEIQSVHKDSVPHTQGSHTHRIHSDSHQTPIWDRHTPTHVHTHTSVKLSIYKTKLVTL